MSGHQDAGGRPIDPPRDNLLRRWTYFVKVCGFTFEFQSVDQIEEAKRYFETKVHPANRQPGIDLEHHWQRWFERLPSGLNGGSKRVRIVKALDEAITSFHTDSG